jgi:uncharacterized repeat protein (TIGR01451 family)
MKIRSRAASLATLATIVFVLAGLGSALDVASASAQANPAGAPAGAGFECGCEPAFTIEKLQEIEGSDSEFTTSPLTGAIGQTVDYQIVVVNTGEVPETFSEFSDPQCDQGSIAGGPGTSFVTPGQTATYTCSRVLATDGLYVNEATVTGTSIFGTPVTHTSNQVVVEVPRPAPGPAPEPAFTIEKRQEIAGSNSGFTASPLTGAIGQTVDYQITVTNTGNEAFATLSFSDPRCDEGTIVGGAGEVPLAPGASTTYSCTRLLGSAGAYANNATATGTPAGGSPLSETSNTVEVTVPPASVPGSSGGASKPASQAVAVGPLQEVLPCTASLPALHGPSGPKRGVFTVRVNSAGIRQITFYLDGHKLKTLKQSQAKGGKFAIKIDPRKLSHGAHTLSIKAIGTDPKCGSIARSSVFVRPVAATRAVKFTG